MKTLARGTRSEISVPGPGHRGQDGVQPGAVGQAYVDVRRRVVEPASRLRRQTLGQPAYGVVVGEPDGHLLEPGAAVDEDLAGPLTSTSVTPSWRSSGSSGPAPTTSCRSAS